MEGFLPEALRGSAVVSAAVVSDVQIAVAAVTATLIAAAVWFVVRVAIDVDVTRPRPSPPQVVAAAARAAPEPAPTATKVVKAPATAEIATRTPSAAEAKINGKRTLGPAAPKQFIDLMDKSRAEILSRISETRWTFMAGENNTDIYTLPDPPKPDRYKAVVLIKAPRSAPGEFVAEVVLRAMFDLKLRENWDKAMIGDRNRTIVYFDRSISITYYRIGAIGTVSSRDFLDLRSLNQLEGNQGFLVVFHSVDWHQQPLEARTAGRSVLRAHNHPTAQLIRRLPDNSCEVTNFVQCDLKGWLPASLIRLSIGGNMISMFKRLREYCEKEASSLYMDAADIERYVAASARG